MSVLSETEKVKARRLLIETGIMNVKKIRTQLEEGKVVIGTGISTYLVFF